MVRRILGLILALAPRSFRERHGRELLAVHEERRRQASGLWSRTRLGLREVAGMVRVVVELRLGAGRERTTPGGGAMIQDLLQDARIAGRGLRRNPGFTAAAAAVLALGIGANTAIFSAANAFFFRPLPFADADRLVVIYETNPEFGWTDATAAPANALDWREQVEAFEDVAMYSEFAQRVPHLRDDGEPVLVGSTAVSGNFFQVLGIRPLLGRDFRWEETWEGRDDVVVLSHALWRDLFGSDPSVVGRSVTFGSSTVEVVGVMPPGVSFPLTGTELWRPLGWAPEARGQTWFRRAHWVRAVARLAPGATLEEADAQLQVVVQRLARDYPETNRVMGAGLAPLRSFLTREVRTPLGVLVAAVALLLLLACTNVANLMLVRAAERSREVAVRRALGAGRWRVARLVFAEGLALAALGGVGGLALGWAGVRAMARLMPLGIDGATGLALDVRVLLFVAALAALSALLFATAPALRAGGWELRTTLAAGGRGGSRGRGRTRGTSVLVAAEVALALVLVVGAGLMVRSALALRAVDPGFDTERTVALQFSVPEARYPERDQVLAFYDQFLERLEALPEVDRAGTVGQLPLAGTSWSSQFQAEGWPPERVGFEILHRRADAAYFEAVGTPLLRGRLFGPADGPDAPLVVVVNETFAETHFPDEEVLGRRIAYDRAANERPDDHLWYEIVGVVADQHQESPGLPPRPEVFENRDQDWGRDNWVVVRTRVAPTEAVSAVRAALHEVDPLIPVARVRPLREVWRNSMVQEDFLLSLLMAFGVVALLLAAVGVYGVTAQAARARTREIGIRLALGAEASGVVRMMVRQGLGVVAVGMVVGLGAALAASRGLRSQLFEVEPTDPATLAAVVLLLGAVAALACWLPARRAARVDPVTSLRAE